MKKKQKRNFWFEENLCENLFKYRAIFVYVSSYKNV